MHSRNRYITNVFLLLLLVFSLIYAEDTISIDTGQILLDTSSQADSTQQPGGISPFPGFSDPFFKGDPFASFGSGFGGGLISSSENNLNINVQDDKVVITANIPGADKGKIDIKLENNTIKVESEMKVEKIEKDAKGNIISKSIQESHFSSSQPIPVPVDTDTKKVDYKDGVLTIELKRPK